MSEKHTPVVLMKLTLPVVPLNALSGNTPRDESLNITSAFDTVIVGLPSIMTMPRSRLLRGKKLPFSSVSLVALYAVNVLTPTLLAPS